MAGKLNLADLPPELQAKVRKENKIPRKTREVSMTVHDVRTYALRCMNVLADLTQAERKRVLRMAEKLNAI